MVNRWICVNGHTLKEQPSRPVCPVCGAALGPLVPVGASEDEVFETLQPPPSRPTDRGPTLMPPALAGAAGLPAAPAEEEVDRTAMPAPPPAKTDVPNRRPTFPVAGVPFTDEQTLSPPATGSATPSVGGAPAPAGSQVMPGYEILGVLGRGGMGVVYKARQSGLNRVVALKMIISGPHASDEELTRFKTEAEAVAALKHPNIVQIHDMGVRDGRPFFSLEYCEGGSLQSRLDGTPMHPQAAARLLRTLADAVGYAHTQHIIHRDLKPANILLLEGTDYPLERCTPKITDFGLAKKLGDEQGNTATEAILGTPTYMAPEQAQGKTRQAGPEADVYALGAILYDLLTGRPPFKGATALDTIQLVQTAEPVPPRRLQPGVPADLQTITLKCLEKDPKKRYLTAADLAADLSRFLEGRPILARPATGAERAWKFVRRNPLLTTLLALCFLAPTALAAVMAAYSVQLAHAKQVADDQRDEARKQRDRAVTAEGERKRERDKAVAAEGEAKQERDRARTAERAARAAEEAAQESFLKVQQAIEQLVRLSEARLRYTGGTDATRQALLRDALRMGQMLLERQGDSLPAAVRVAHGHRLVGDIEEKLGNYESALRHFDQSARHLDGVLSKRPDLTDEAVGVEMLRWKVLETVAPDRAVGVLDRALARLDGVPAAARQGPAARWTRAAVLANRAIHHQNRAASGQAIKDLNDAAGLLEKLAEDEQGARLVEVKRELGRVLANRAALGLAQAQRGGLGHDLLAALWGRPGVRKPLLVAAAADCGRAVERFEGLLDGRKADPEVLKELARVLTTKGLVLAAQGRTADARAVAARAVARFRAAAEESPNFVDPRHLLGLALSDRGLYEYLAEDYPAAAATLTEAREVLGALAAQYPSAPGFRRSLARADTTFCLTLMKRKKFDEARALLESTLAWFRQARDAEGVDLVRTNLLICRDQLSRLAERLDPREAADHLDALAALRRERLAGLPNAGDARSLVCRILAATELLFTLQAQARLLDDARDYRAMSRVVEEMERLAGPSWPAHVEHLPGLARAIGLDRVGAKRYGEQALRLLRGQRRSPQLDEFLAAPDLGPIRALPGYRAALDSLPRP